jgi:hypothetical protein
MPAANPPPITLLLVDSLRNPALAAALRTRSRSWHRVAVVDGPVPMPLSVHVDAAGAQVHISLTKSSLGSSPIGRAIALGLPGMWFGSSADAQFTAASWSTLVLGAWEVLRPNVLPRCRAEDWIYLMDLSWASRCQLAAELGALVPTSTIGNGLSILSSADSAIVHEIETGGVWLRRDAPANPSSHYEIMDFGVNARIMSAILLDNMCWLFQMTSQVSCPCFDGPLTESVPGYAVLRSAVERWGLCNLLYAVTPDGIFLLNVRLDVTRALHPEHLESFIDHLERNISSRNS